MFINTYYETKESTMHIWEMVDGVSNYRTQYWIPYVFLRATGGDVKTIDGHQVAKKTFDSYQDYYSFCKERANVYENKVRPEIQFLAETYHQIPDDEIEVPKLKIYSLDIEVAHEDSFPNTRNPEFPVVLVTLYGGDRSVTFGEKEYTGELPKDTYYIQCNDESELLRKLFAYMNKYPCDVLTGWNIYNFDLPYLINRSKKLFGEDSKIFAGMSPINIVRVWDSEKGDTNIDIAGVTILDYYDIYKWYGPNLESYRLDYVAYHALGEGKIEYSHYEDLREVYREDWNLYVTYNITDAKRVYQLEEKCGYIKLVQSLSLLTKCPMKYYHTMTQLIEGALLTHYRRNKMCAPIFIGGFQETFEAAYVKEPQRGKHEWIVDLDIVSSYPTAIITLNMSTETYFGKIVGLPEDQVMEYTKQREFPDFDMFKDVSGIVNFRGPRRDKFNESLKRKLLAIAPNGSVFTTHKIGTLAEVQRNIFAKRKEVKGKMIELKKQLAEKEDQKMKERAKQLFDLQWALKILLNAMFGVTAVPYSRYFNTSIAEAITACGRQTIKAGERYVNEYLQTRWVHDEEFMSILYDEMYDPDLDKDMIEHTEDTDWVAYIDTDSLFIKMGEFLKRVVSAKSKWADLNDEAKIEKVRKLSQCIEKIVNEKCFVNIQKAAYNSPVDDFTILFKQEIVAKSAIFIMKKKYAYWAVNEEGAPCDKISITGLEMVRSDTAEAVRIVLKEVVDMILRDATDKEIIKRVDECRDSLKKVFPEEIAANIGINKLDKYLTKEGWRKGAPWHVKGVWNYRMLLKELGIENEYEDIPNGTKARVVYVKPNPYGVETISFLRWPKEFDKVVQIDYETMIDKFFLKKIKTLLKPMDKEELIDGMAKERLGIFFEGI